MAWKGKSNAHLAVYVAGIIGPYGLIESLHSLITRYWSWVDIVLINFTLPKNDFQRWWAQCYAYNGLTWNAFAGKGCT